MCIGNLIIGRWSRRLEDLDNTRAEERDQEGSRREGTGLS